GGIVSEGMLCSEEELGLAPLAEGILTFAPGTFQPGTPFYTAFPYAKDTIFGIGVTPNRPDALGHRGVARDLAAAFALDYAPETPDFAPLANGAATLKQRVTIDNQAPEACPRYGAALVENVTV